MNIRRIDITSASVSDQSTSKSFYSEVFRIRDHQR
jgi:predicted enzyme related to lactoylglutathione lyase